MSTTSDFLTPRTRGKITRALHDRAKWSGSRQGYRLTFRRVAGFLFAEPSPATLEWFISDESGRRLGNGTAETVFDAAEQIGQILGKIRMREC